MEIKKVIFWVWKICGDRKGLFRYGKVCGDKKKGLFWDGKVYGGKEIFPILSWEGLWKLNKASFWEGKVYRDKKGPILIWEGLWRWKKVFWNDEKVFYDGEVYENKKRSFGIMERYSMMGRFMEIKRSFGITKKVFYDDEVGNKIGFLKGWKGPLRWAGPCEVMGITLKIVGRQLHNPRPV